MRVRRPLRIFLAGALILTGCNALLDVKEIYLDRTPSQESDGGPDASNDVAASDGSTSETSTDGGPCNLNTVMTDKLNCGRCGHDCQGGTCTAGQCGPVTLQATLAQPSGLAIDATHVYVANRGDGTVIRVPKAGGAPEQLVTGQENTRGVAVMGTTLFWSNDSGTGGLWKCTLPTCQDKVKINPTSFLRHLDAKDPYIYFATQGDVRRVIPDGGDELVVVPNATQPFAIAVDTTHVYYTSSQNDVYRNLVSDGGGEEPVGPLTGSANIGFISLDNDSFYWAYAEGDATGHVFGAKKAAIALRTTYGTANKGSIGVASDGTNVFFTNDGTLTGMVSNSDGELVYCPKQGCGGTGPVKLVDKLKFAGPIVLDATTIYFLEYGGNGAPTGTVRKIAKP